ncbi:MAG: hypothetical protein ACOC1L_05260 [Bacillota bacterium]
MEIVIIVLIIFILTLISFGISYAISKTFRGYAFIVPTIYTIFTITSFIIAYSLDNWAALGYMIIAILLLVASIASWIASIVLYIANQKNSKKKDF